MPQRALALKAWAAWHRMLNHCVMIAERPSRYRIGGAKDAYGWHIFSTGQMHGARVIGDQQTAGAELNNQLRQLGFSDEIRVLDAADHG